MNPNRASTYLEPKKAFDDLYWMGTPSRSTWALTTSDGIILYDTQGVYDAEDVIVGGLKKLGLDPAKVKYVIISHAHDNQVGGAKLMQERYRAHIVMGAGDWDMVDQSINWETSLSLTVRLPSSGRWPIGDLARRIHSTSARLRWRAISKLKTNARTRFSSNCSRSSRVPPNRVGRSSKAKPALGRV